MRRKLLLADDSVTIQRVIEMTFAGEDVQVLAVGDGEEAIARIPIERPDIVLADIGMPKRSGYEVSAFVKGNPDLARTPVLLLAGAFEPVDEAKAKEAKCDGVLVKPFEPQNVIARVRELIDGASGSPTESAVRDIARPAAVLTPPRPVELPKREDPSPVPSDLVDVDFGEDDMLPHFDEAQIDPPEGAAAAQPLVLDDSLDDYFDKLDEAFATINTTISPSGSLEDSAGDHDDARPARQDRPLLEDEIESFDDPAAAPAMVFEPPPVHADAAASADVDPLAGLDGIEAEEMAFPTLDDLLADMPASTNLGELSFDDLPSPGMTFDEAPVAKTPAPPPSPAPFAAPVPVANLAPFQPIAGVALPVEAASGRSIIADAFSALLAAEQGEPGTAAPLRLAASGSAVITDSTIDDVARRVIQKLALGSSEQLQAIVKDIVSGVAERLVREEIDRIRRNAPPT